MYSYIVAHTTQRHHSEVSRSWDYDYGYGYNYGYETAQSSDATDEMCTVIKEVTFYFF